MGSRAQRRRRGRAEQGSLGMAQGSPQGSPQSSRVRSPVMVVRRLRYLATNGDLAGYLSESEAERFIALADGMPDGMPDVMTAAEIRAWWDAHGIEYTR